MKKRSKSVPKVDPYIDGLMSKLLERLVSLEKKIDALVFQGSGRPASSAQPMKPVQLPAQQPRRDRLLYEAVCAECSKVCEVPFKPTEERPVYCKECWAKRRAGGRPGTNSRPGMPVLTPVAIPQKPASKLSASAQAPAPARETPKKAKKNPVKKTKKTGRKK